jgi:hypothetical protein
MLSGAGHEGPFGRQDGFVPADRNFVKNRRAQVPVDGSGPDDTEGLETMRPLNLCAHF